MDFQKYINHNITPTVHQSCNLKKAQLKPRVIKFVGNMQENIKQLLQSINCHCSGRKQFYNILLVFANKIEKLRKQREHYKTTLKQYLLSMSNNSLKNGHVQKCKRHESQRKAQTVLKKEQQVSTKYSVGYMENSTPLKKVADLFMREKSRTLYINERFPEHFSNTCNKNQPTLVKKPANQQSESFSKTLDKRLSDYFSVKKQQDTRGLKVGEEEGSFSLNLSSIEEGDMKKQNCQELTKQVSSILNETNLLDSDDDDIKQFKTPCKEYQTKQDTQLEGERSKMGKKSTVFEDIELTVDQQPSISTKDMTVIKRKQNPQQLTISNISVQKSDHYHDKQNMRGQVCLKKYNISIEKLEQFLQNKQCLRQIEKAQSFDMHLKGFKSVSMGLYGKQAVNDYGYGSVMRTVRPVRPLQERRFNFNCG